ncbi:unnamed protein product [Symbiodinium sp. CCMP2592]|nr:unnamed protein product [Symbiodinium sp. CCMP2592]
MPGFGYGYGASRETSDSETSSRDSESSESLASEVEVGQSIPRVHQKGTKAGQGPQRPDVQGDTPEALPKRRRVTFKEEVLILTDSTREFTKLNLRHGSTRKRFKEPPPVAKRARADDGARTAIRSPPPERRVLESDIRSLEVRRQVKTEGSQEAEQGKMQVAEPDGRKKNRKEKSHSPGGSTTRQGDEVGRVQEPDADRDVPDVPAQGQKQEVKQKRKKQDSARLPLDRKMQHDASEHEAAQAMPAAKVAPPEDPSREGREQERSSPRRAATEIEENPEVPSKKEPWNLDRSGPIDFEEPTSSRSSHLTVDPAPRGPSTCPAPGPAEVVAVATANSALEDESTAKMQELQPEASETSDAKAATKDTPIRGIRLAKEWRPPPSLVLPKAVQPWNAAEYRGTEMRSRAKSRQTQLQVEAPQVVPQPKTSQEAARGVAARGIRLAEEWRPPPPLALPEDIQQWNPAEYRGTELRARAKSRQHLQLQVEEAGDYTTKLAGLLRALETDFAEPAALLKRFWMQLAMGERERFVQEFPQFLRYLPDAMRATSRLP